MMVKSGHRTSAIIGVLAISISHIGIGYAFNLASLFIFFSLPAGQSDIATSPVLSHEIVSPIMLRSLER